MKAPHPRNHNVPNERLQGRWLDLISEVPLYSREALPADDKEGVEVYCLRAVDVEGRSFTIRLDALQVNALGTACARVQESRRFRERLEAAKAARLRRYQD